MHSSTRSAANLGGQVRDSFRFFRAIVRDRRSVGAIAPSGRYLATVVVRSLGAIPPGSIIVELGPGTGSFTKVLLQRHPHSTIVAIEIDRQLVSGLRRSLPQAQVVHGCATRIREHLAELGLDPDKVAGVVSGLPLLALPKQLPAEILHEVAEVLPEGKPFVQFTYSRLAWRRFTPRRLQFRRAQLVMTNIPPATVLSFSKAGNMPVPKAKNRKKIRLLGAFRRRRRTSLS